eukprot:954672-Prymnesium_polylepis.1
MLASGADAAMLADHVATIASGAKGGRRAVELRDGSRCCRSVDVRLSGVSACRCLAVCGRSKRCRSFGYSAAEGRCDLCAAR